MTLYPFPPSTLDELALRLLDLAAVYRDMAHRSREFTLSGFELHANKLNEWLSHLEDWTHDASARLEASLNKQRGARRAQQPVYPASHAPAAKKKRGGRRKK